jgi:hypothetical protein
VDYITTSAEAPQAKKKGSRRFLAAETPKWLFGRQRGFAMRRKICIVPAKEPDYLPSAFLA